MGQKSCSPTMAMQNLVKDFQKEMNKGSFRRLFHSTPLLERKSRTSWEPRCNRYSRRFRRTRAKQTLLRNVNAYAQFMFQSWKGDTDEDDPSSSRGTPWFGKLYSSKGSGRYRMAIKDQSLGDHEFCKDDFDVENIFRSAFGGNRSFYWSFINEENPQWKKSEDFSRNWRRRSENEHGSSRDSGTDYSYSGLVSDRLALGLSASGPLRLEDVKIAYRACALKWHPDRHQGSSKVIAEEKFKHCSAAYQSLCDKLALD